MNVQNQTFRVQNSLQERGLVVGVVIAYDVAVRPSSQELESELGELVAHRKTQEFPPASTKEAVRNLLKIGGFKPSGRNKPASEYLANAAREDRFPFINNLVDVNNLVSLMSGLPISLLDGNAIGDCLSLRYGREGERYVFNSAGQEIDLAGLICACTAATDVPLGNPIKDSIQGKIKDSTSTVAGVIYSPKSSSELAESVHRHLSLFSDLLKREGGATRAETFVQ
jgi:DNA/RNA-binding domain of Phe-tRNA-synthetase-like protein